MCVQLEQLTMRPNEQRSFWEQFPVTLPRASVLDCAVVARVRRFGHKLEATCSEAVHEGKLEGAARFRIGQGNQKPEKITP